MMSDWNMLSMSWGMSISVLLVLAGAVALGYMIGRAR